MAGETSGWDVSQSYIDVVPQRDAPMMMKAGKARRPALRRRHCSWVVREILVLIWVSDVPAKWEGWGIGVQYSSVNPVTFGLNSHPRPAGCSSTRRGGQSQSRWDCCAGQDPDEAVITELTKVSPDRRVAASESFARKPEGMTVPVANPSGDTYHSAEPLTKEGSRESVKTELQERWWRSIERSGRRIRPARRVPPGTAQTSVDTVSDISGCHVALTRRERELVFDRGEPTEDALAPAAIVGVLDPHDDGAVELVATLPALLVEDVLL